MSILSTNYAKIVDSSHRVAWRLDDIFPADTSLDFGKPFMPDSMFVGRSLAFLSDGERLQLNQIFGNAYGYLFYFVEAFIIDMAMQHAEAERYGNDDNLRAMLRFAEEEVKHQQMFLRFGEMFARGFGSECEVVPSPQMMAQVVLEKTPMAVTLVTLHLEIITQAHYVDCIRDQAEIEPLFQSLFKYHWVEEAQHAKIDALELAKMRRESPPEAVQQAIDDYFEIATALAGVLAEQAGLDVASLERATGRTFSEAERAAIEAAQRRSYNRAFLWSGVTNSAFLEFLAEHFPNALERAAQAAETFA